MIKRYISILQGLRRAVSIDLILKNFSTHSGITHCLNRRRAIIYTTRPAPRIVAGDIQLAEAVHIPVEVGDVAGAQGHVGATEQ
ncbi:hypothetical protein KUT96_32025, partial [Pseudomonas aeruginosa]|nr:hypothetical protein [Pseudomonas aeruginosa]